MTPCWPPHPLAKHGDGPSLTKITANRHAPQFAAPKSATVYVQGDGFIAKYITFENTAGPEQGRGVALLNMANHSIFYQCGQNQGRKRPQRNTSFTLQNCSITMDPRLSSSYKRTIRGFLGRPLFRYSRVMVMESYLDSIIDPYGWFSWPNETMKRSVIFREFKNWGPGVASHKRVSWGGYRVVKRANQAKPYTAAKLIDGNAWIPVTRVPYYGSFASDV